jgi:superfamily I DNA/RNA helicase
VASDTKQIIYFGPPGTGKTTTLLERLTEELRQTAPDRIAFLTFTRRARMEAVQRVEQALSIKSRDLPYFRTIHSMAFRALGLKDGEVTGYKELCEFGASMGLKFGTQSVTEQASEGINSQDEGDHMLALHHLARVRGRTLKQTWSEAKSDVDWVKVDHFAKSYEEWKRVSALLDFTDVLTEFVKRQIILPLDIAFIDEAQDLSSMQWLAALQATVTCKTRYVAGDDDQAIYRWAGADVTFFMQLQGERRILTKSYRLPRAVHELSQSIAHRIKQRVAKQFTGRDDEGLIRRHATIDSMEMEPGSQWLWLVRNRFLIPRLRGMLENRGVVFSQHGQSSITQSDRDAIYCWERLRAGKQIASTMIRTMYAKMLSGQHIARGHKLLPGVADDATLTLAELQEHHGLIAPTNVPWFDTLLSIPLERRMYYRSVVARHSTLMLQPLVQLETIHGAKGAEAQNVAVFTEVSRRVLNEMRTMEDDEHRVWYVAVTRARERLHIIEPSSRYAYSMPHKNV